MLPKTRIGLGSQCRLLLLCDLFRISVFVLDDVWNVSPYRDQNTSQPSCCERSSRAQNTEWRSPRCEFPVVDRSVCPMNVLEHHPKLFCCAQHCCLLHSRCSRLTGLVITESFISLHVHNHPSVVLEVD